MKIKLKTKLILDDRYKILLVLVWVRSILVSYVYQFLLRIPLIADFAYPIKVFVYLIAALFASRKFLRNLKLRDYFIYIVFCLLYSINIDVYPNTSEYLIERAVEILLIAVPTFFVGLTQNKDEYMDLLFKWSKICIVAIVIYFMIFGHNAEIGRTTDENMGVAYRILPHLIMTLYYYLKFHRIEDGLFALISGLLLLACGTRGPVLNVVVFLAFYIMFYSKAKHKIFIVILLTIFAVTMYINPSILFDPIIYLFDKLGFSTRVLDGILTGIISDDNGRTEIKMKMFEMISQNNYKGYGIAGDRNIVKWMAYSHNILIEFLVSYGMIIGFVLFVLILFLITKGFILANEKQRGFISVLFFSGGFFKLFFSGSYLLEPLFFWLLGYLVMVIRTNKYKYRRKDWFNENSFRNK